MGALTAGGCWAFLILDLSCGDRPLGSREALLQARPRDLSMPRPRQEGRKRSSRGGYRGLTDGVLGGFQVLVLAVKQLFPEFEFMWLVDEAKKNLPLELDFLNEGRNAEKVAQMLKHFDFLKVGGAGQRGAWWCGERVWGKTDPCPECPPLAGHEWGRLLPESCFRTLVSHIKALEDGVKRNTNCDC